MAKGSSSYTEFNNLMEQLEKNQIAPVYLLHGEEYYFLEQLITKIEEVVIDKATASFNHHVFYGKETQVSDIVNIARRFPMMADKQLVIFKEAQYCKSPDAIIPYLENPVESTILVWYHPSKKLPMNRKLGMAMKKMRSYTLENPFLRKKYHRFLNCISKKRGMILSPDHCIYL